MGRGQGSKTSNKGGGQGKSVNSGNFTAEQSAQIAKQTKELDALPPLAKQQKITNALNNIAGLEKRIEHMKKLNNNDRFRAENDAVTRKSIDDRLVEISKNETQIRMIKETLSRVK